MELKKVLTSSVVGISALFLATSSAFAATENTYYSFSTDDGKYEITGLSMGSSTSNNDIKLTLTGLYKYDDNYTYPVTVNPGTLKVRLCNSTGTCTSFKNFEPNGTATFTSMKYATYVVDIMDGSSSYSIDGKIKYDLY